MQKKDPQVWHTYAFVSTKFSMCNNQNDSSNVSSIFTVKPNTVIITADVKYEKKT